MIDIVTASHNEFILRDNLLKSEIFKTHPLIVQRNYSNVSKAYNEAKKVSDIVAYVHHDVFLPPTFERDLINSLHLMHTIDPNWGVLGVAGVKLNPGKQIRGYILDRGRVWGRPIGKPVEVDTIDELLLIKRNDLQFDENLDHDFYGADICMQAKAQGKKNYVINGFLHHNSGRAIGGRTESFYRRQQYFKNKWKEYLPVATTCAMIENV